MYTILKSNGLERISAFFKVENLLQVYKNMHLNTKQKYMKSTAVAFRCGIKDALPPLFYIAFVINRYM